MGDNTLQVLCGESSEVRDTAIYTLHVRNTMPVDP